MAEFRPLLLLAVTVFIDLLGFGIILPNLPQYIELAVGPNHKQAAFIGSLLAASYSFAQFLCAPLWGRYSDRVGRRPVILISLLGVSAAYALFGIAGASLWLLFRGPAFGGLFVVGVHRGRVCLCRRCDPARKKGAGLGAFGRVFWLGLYDRPGCWGNFGAF